MLKFKKRLTSALDVVLIIAVALLVIDVVWGVFTRYVMGEQAKWSEELARFLLVWVSLLGGAVAFGTKGHLGVDFFVSKFDPQARKIMAVFVHLVVAGTLHQCSMRSCPADTQCTRLVAITIYAVALV